jgi:capsular exopolysaccharide synthesis family protein
MASQQLARSDQGSFNLKEYFFKYLRFLPLYLLFLFLSLTAAWLYLRYTTPVYSSSAQLLLEAEKKGSNENDKFQELFVDTRSKNIQNEIEYIKSKPLMKRVVEALQLNYSYLAKGKIKDENAYKQVPFYAEALGPIDSSTTSFKVKFEKNNAFRINDGGTLYGFGQTFKVGKKAFRLVKHQLGVPNPSYVITWTPTRTVATTLLSQLVVTPKQGGSILVLSMQGDNPYLIADVINKLMAVYQSATVEDKNATTRQTLEFLDGRLRVLSRELDSVTNRLLSYQQAHNLTDVDIATANYYSKAEETDQALNQQKSQLSQLNLIETYVRDTRMAYNIVPSSLGIEDQTLSTLISAYNVAQLERKSLLDSNVPQENPVVKQKEEQIEKLRRNILENVNNLQRAYSSSLGELRSRNSDIQAQIRMLPIKQQNFIEIKRQQESKLTVYNFLMEKREESAISLAATISNIKVLDDASPRTIPVKPNNRNTYLIAFVVGLVVPTIIIVISEILNDKVSTREDIEKVTSATILGEVGHSSGEETLIVTPGNRSFVAEQFRIIRSNLQYVLTSQPKSVILVTSSFSGEGKSFISTNIGGVMAVTPKKTIILEFDIRKPKILSQLHMPKHPGLTNYLLGKASLDDLPILVPGHTNLFVLACGPIPPNPSELLLDPKVDDLFAYLKERFEVIVIDTAPVGMVSDALTLGKYADCSVYIVRQGVTHKKQLELINEFHHQGKLPKLNVILNDIRLHAGYGYYGYGRYGYGYGKSYGYGHGYYDDDKKENGFFNQWFGWLNNKKKKSRKRKSETIS